jgi:DNA-3-methyladenine glycosylase
MKLDKDFYSKRAPEMAPSLIGKLLCRKICDNSGERVIKLRITETECYFGEEDTACHAHKGKTERTKVMYHSGGVAYIYLCYGIHSLLNIVSGPEDFPEAVLIRGVEGYDGPGKLTKVLAIDRSLNGEDLIASDKLWLEDDGFSAEYTVGKRIGIDYATEEYRNILWRYTMFM